MKATHRRAAVTALIPLFAITAGAGFAADLASKPSAASGTVTGLSLVPASGRAEVVIVVDAAVTVKDFRLPTPERVVVDLHGARLDMPPRGYDRVARGGVTNVRYAQFQPNVVRVVLELSGPHAHQVTRDGDEVRVSIAGTVAEFDPWTVGERAFAASAAPAQADASATDYAEVETSAEPEQAPLRYDPAPAPTASRAVARPVVQVAQPAQPRITVTYEDADIRDVIAAFATFAGRTIVVGREVAGTVTAEIRNQPWDVALRAILQGQGLAASEDPVTGIIAVDSYQNIASRQATEPLTTRMVPINYSRAAALAPLVRELLTRECAPGGVPQAPGQTAQTSCVPRGGVVADTLTNSLLITEAPSRMGGLLDFIQNLDLRTPQVAIKAKIIFVNRTDIEDIGISYDLGTRDQFFSRLAPRVDPSTLTPIDSDGDGVPDSFGGGTPITGDRILLGGNTISAIANANQRVTNPALQVVFSTALGRFSLTSFIDALQEVRMADLQAEPSVVTLNNRRAEILVGQEIPIRVLDAGAGQGAGQPGGQQNIPRATVQLKEVGIILSVVPQVTNNRQILLTVHAENSDAQLASSDVGFIFGKQRADNQLLVNDGETAVIGGLTVTQVTQAKAGIPLLVDLPFVGRLFGQTRTSEEKRDLLILITPHIVDEGERMEATLSR
jgi:type IV pilus assembly protein PilQ